MQAVECDNLAWQEKHRAQGQENIDGDAAGKDGVKPPADTVQATAPASGEAVGGEQEGDGEEEEDATAPTVGNLTYVMFRADRRSKAVRKQKGARGAPAVEWSALNDEAKTSVVEIVNERREAIERIAHGMRWP